MDSFLNRKGNQGKIHKYSVGLFFLSVFLFSFLVGIAQGHLEANSDLPADSVVAIAGKEYGKGPLYRWFWGNHYRAEWTTPVRVKKLWLDSVFGGLKALEQGGGRQSKTLRLENKSGKQFVLRTVDKNFHAIIPEDYKNTFIEYILNDQVSTTHPYAALTVPILAKAAGIYHTNPQIVFVPEQPALEKYKQDFANTLCLFEERPDGNQKDAPNFGNAKDVVGTDKMLEKITEESNHQVDQRAFLRARLFDMFLGDWGRHEDQWRWAKFDSGEQEIYKPIPRDRDQTFSKFDGLIPNLVRGHVDQLQTFDYTVKDIKKYNFPGRYIDRRLLNELPVQRWLQTAGELQQLLSDSVIEAAIRQLPPEIFSISGEEIISKLKSRRGHLPEYATEYYKFLAKEVDITGTLEDELFVTRRVHDGETEVKIYKLNNKHGEVSNDPFYSRIFYTGETNEIRLYGLRGNDQYRVEGKTGKGIEIRIIGGPQRDVFNDSSSVKGISHKTKIYDDADNDLKISSETKMYLSGKTLRRLYDYKSFQYDNNKTRKSISYNQDDRIYARIGYRIQKQQWGKYPFGHQHDFNLNYSFMQNAFSAQYEGLVNQLIGNWNLTMHAGYDFIRDPNFFGVGNETEFIKGKRRYYKVRSRQLDLRLGINKHIWLYHQLGISGFFESIKILNDKDRFVGHGFSYLDTSVFRVTPFIGAQLNYSFQKLNDLIVPTEGINLVSTVAYHHNLRNADRSFTRYSMGVEWYIPLIKALSFSVRSGAATISGNPDFYQLNWIGGARTLRGYARQRFYGRTSFYGDGELRWIMNIKSYFYNGKIGFLTLLDNGRVWQPGENSRLWHTGYGGGIILSPFNKAALTATYAISKENKLFQIKVNAIL